MAASTKEKIKQKNRAVFSCSLGNANEITPLHSARFTAKIEKVRQLLEREFKDTK